MLSSWVNVGVIAMLLPIAGSLPLARSPWHAPPPAGLVAQQLAALPRGTPLLIDGDNVRGKSAFTLSQAALLGKVQRLDAWLAPDVRTQLHFDHGAQRDAFEVVSGESPPVCVVFSGPVASADDTICRDVQWWARHLRSEEGAKDFGGAALANHARQLPRAVVVVTDDAGLRDRCRRSAKATSGLVTLVSSHSFMEFLKAQILEEADSEQSALRFADSCREASGSEETDGRTADTTAFSCDSEPPLAETAVGGHPSGTAVAASDDAAAAVAAAVAAVQQEQYLRGELRKARQQIKHG
jgi:hypothetical protein